MLLVNTNFLMILLLFFHDHRQVQNDTAGIETGSPESGMLGKIEDYRAKSGK